MKMIFKGLMTTMVGERQMLEIGFVDFKQMRFVFASTRRCLRERPAFKDGYNSRGLVHLSDLT